MRRSNSDESNASRRPERAAECSSDRGRFLGRLPSSSNSNISSSSNSSKNDGRDIRSSKQSNHLRTTPCPSDTPRRRHGPCG